MFTITITGNSLDDIFKNAEMLLALKPGEAIPEKPAANPAEPAILPPVHTVQPARPSYSLEQLAKAGADLVQMGKMQQTLALLAKYEVDTINQLPPERYDAIAADLRDLGANL